MSDLISIEDARKLTKYKNLQPVYRFVKSHDSLFDQIGAKNIVVYKDKFLEMAKKKGILKEDQNPNAIKKLRLAAGLNQKQFASAIGYSQQRLSELERQVNFKPATFDKIKAALEKNQ